MNISVGNIVNIKESIDKSCSIDQKYIGQRGIVKEINEDRPSPITVFVKDVGEDSFWEEELEVIEKEMESSEIIGKVMELSDYKKEDYKKEAYDKGKKIAEDLSNALNSMTFDKKVIEGFVDGVTQQHRTIQQSSMRAIYALIQGWALMAESGYYDLRNEKTVKFCQEIVKKCKGDNFPFI